MCGSQIFQLHAVRFWKAYNASVGGGLKYKRGSVGVEMEQFLSNCRKRGLRITPQRRQVIETLLEAQDHPDAATLHQRVRRRNPTISAATVYRTLNLLEEGGILIRHDFQTSMQRNAQRNIQKNIEGNVQKNVKGNVKGNVQKSVQGNVQKSVQGNVKRNMQGSSSARYELAGEHHDHLIDLQNDSVVEFYDEELEELQVRIAARLGYQLVNHQMILYGIPKKASKASAPSPSRKTASPKPAKPQPAKPRKGKTSQS